MEKKTGFTLGRFGGQKEATKSKSKPSSTMKPPPPRPKDLGSSSPKPPPPRPKDLGSSSPKPPPPRPAGLGVKPEPRPAGLGAKPKARPKGFEVGGSVSNPLNARYEAMKPKLEAERKARREAGAAKAAAEKSAHAKASEARHQANLDRVKANAAAAPMKWHGGIPADAAKYEAHRKKLAARGTTGASVSAPKPKGLKVGGTVNSRGNKGAVSGKKFSGTY